MKLLKDSRRIKVRVFMEVMGWPKEGLTKHLKEVIQILQDKTEWKVTKEQYAEPEKIGEKMYTTHVEFEGEPPNLPTLFMFSLMFGPSTIEILEPDELYITASELQEILSDVISKVQGMDKDIKVLSSTIKQMEVREKQTLAIFEELEKKGILHKKPIEDKKDKTD
jgi:hypothetical protein